MIVHQHDHAGILIGHVEAAPSPLEPGKFLIPARCVVTAPPAEVPEGMAARWNGAAWAIVPAPTQHAAETPVAKLQAFLAANPDVADLIG